MRQTGGAGDGKCVLPCIASLAEGEYGALVNWFHLACARHDNFAVGYAKMGDDAMSKKILGYADMPADLLLGG